MQIALFGTSADPPTRGHQEILKWLSYHYAMVAVWAADNPFKGSQTPLEHRTAMLKLAIEELEKRNLKLYQELSDRRSLISVQKAGLIFGKDAYFTLVIGADILQQITNWYQIEELLKLVQLLIIPRPKYSILEEDLERLRSLGGKLSIAQLNTPAVSSTVYREQVEEEIIPVLVRDYIKSYHLYNLSK